ncbi:MAG: DUF362 domain-containing protein [Actinobacteria bacterium]|nr:DUF362 domain-containing protein [Actinomycetota bacterium]
MSVAIIETADSADVRRAVDLLGGMKRFVSEGERVVIKPNVCAGKDSSTGTVTDPVMVAEVCRMVAECGAQPVVAESPIYPFRSGRVLERSGYADFEKKYGFLYVDLDSAENVEIKIPAGRAITNSVVGREVLTCDRLINMPVMKTHLQTVVTLGLKNLKGVVVGKQKHIIHLEGLDAGIVDLNTVIRSDLIIIDGIIGMEGMGGPTNGRACRMDVIVAGDNVVETDATATRIMGGDPREVEHIRMASERGLGSMDGFDLLGDDIGSVTVKRDLPRMPGLNKFLITDVSMRLWNALRVPLMRLTGGETIKRRAVLGELVIDAETCDGCRLCIAGCPVDALIWEDALVCDRDACIRCFCCAEICGRGALSKKF